MLFASIIGIFLGNFFRKIYYNITKFEDYRITRLNSYYDTLSGWLRFKQQDKKIEDYLLKAGYNNVAIYALGEIGERLFYELKGTRIQVLYAIDQNIDMYIDGLETLTKEDDLPDVDVIIVTIGFAYESIKSDLEKKVNCPIISLQKLVYEIALSEEGVY